MRTRTRIAYNSYTLRDKLKGAEQIEDTLRKSSEIGYRAVELDLDGMRALDLSKLKDLLSEIDLTPFAAHVEFDRLRDSFDGVLSDCKHLGVEYVVVPNLPRDKYCKDAAGYRRGALELAELSKELRNRGFKFAYHNHAREFEKFDGKVAMELIFFEEKEDVRLPAEVDVYWVQYAGADPAQWIRRLSGMVPLVHVKDMGMAQGKQMSTEVGEGNLNWPQIIEACEASEVQWYIVEQEDFLRDPLECIKTSKENLNRMGIT